MRSFRRTAMPAVVLVATLAAVSCTSDDAPPDAVSVTATGVAPVASDVGDVAFVPGEFAYDFNGIKASLTMEGSTGTLDVKNGSPGPLGKPGMYVIGGDGKRYEGSVASATTIADGAEASFEVSFPDQVAPDTIGLAVLLFGGSNAGAMAPVPA